MRLTVWHKGTDKPVRNGVYQREYSQSIMFCKFAVGKWFFNSLTIDGAAFEKIASLSQDLPWRGIVKD